MVVSRINRMGMGNNMLSEALREIAQVKGVGKILFTPYAGLVLLPSVPFQALKVLQIKDICEKWKIEFNVVE